MMEKYRGSGLKLTPQRIAILQYLDGNIEHPTAEDIYKAVSKKYPTMSFATVYNTLEVLKRHGHLSELNIDPYRKRFDPNPKPHHHLICIHCNKIIDIHLEFSLNLPKSERQEFEIIRNQIQFYGICPKCKKG